MFCFNLSVRKKNPRALIAQFKVKRFSKTLMRKWLSENVRRDISTLRSFSNMRLCSQAEGLAEWHSNIKSLNLTKDPSPPKKKISLPRFERQMASVAKGEKGTSLGRVQQCSEPSTEPAKGCLHPSLWKAKCCPSSAFQMQAEVFDTSKVFPFFFPLSNRGNVFER